MSILEFQSVKKDYRLGETTVHALRSVDLAVGQGEFIAVLGSSGSGKTTLLNLAGAIDDPTEGRVSINGADIASLTDNRKAELRNRTIGYVFQTFNLVPVLSALENVMLALQIRGGKRSVIREEARYRLDEVGLADFMHQRPDKLSGGQRQRVAIARALVVERRALARVAHPARAVRHHAPPGRRPRGSRRARRGPRSPAAASARPGRTSGRSASGRRGSRCRSAVPSA